MHLLRSTAFSSLEVILLNRSRPVARGLAYETRSTAHVLNVPAGRMGALAGDEDGFLRFVQQTQPSVESGDFLPRSWYGDYLESLLTDAERSAPRGVTLTRLLGEAIRIDASDGGKSALIRLNDGRTIMAHRVVLACGNFMPPNVPGCGDLAGSPTYIRDPWANGAIRPGTGQLPVLLVGSGLTMADIALLIDRTGGTAPVFALSRRGLLPQPHRAHGHHQAPPGAADQLLAGPPTARAYLAAIRAQVRLSANDGVDWRDIVAALRSITPQLWERLPLVERARFLRHLRPYWDAHRHRSAPVTAMALQRLIARGRLVPLAGRLIRCTPDARGLTIEWRRRGCSQTERLQVGTMVNCIGPDTNVERVDEPLIRSLREQGWLRADPLGLGIDANDGYQVLSAEGRPSDLLSYIGPLLKGRYWEITAVPELRAHAKAMVRALVASLNEPAVELLSEVSAGRSESVYSNQ